MSSPSAPRHLAPRQPGLSARRRLLVAGGAVAALAIGAVVIALVIGGPSAPGPSAGGPLPSASPTPSSAPVTAAPSPPTRARSDTTTTTGPAQRLRPVPGNLLSNGDFERGLSGWGPLGGARVERIAVAHSGAWAARIEPVQAGAPARPGIASLLGVEGRQGRTYKGSAWVRASRPGTEVTLALRESAGDGQSSADTIGISLQDSDWHEVAVVHQLRLAGARLSLELTGGNLEAGDLILIDEVGVTAP